MPPLLQVKLMRVLQEKEIERIGGKPRQVDFRVISATNLDLETMVRLKTFRLDLFYRLNVIIIRLPPLRDIPEDILPIFNRFLNQLSRENHRRIHAISPEATGVLRQNSWPGNIRELRNVAEPESPDRECRAHGHPSGPGGDRPQPEHGCDAFKNPSYRSLSENEKIPYPVKDKGDAYPLKGSSLRAACILSRCSGFTRDSSA